MVRATPWALAAGVFGALVAAPATSIWTPQDLAYKPVGLDYGNGTAYAGILMLEGAMSRQAVTTVAAPVSPSVRLDMVLRGEIAATAIREEQALVLETLVQHRSPPRTELDGERIRSSRMPARNVFDCDTTGRTPSRRRCRRWR